MYLFIVCLPLLEWKNHKGRDLVHILHVFPAPRDNTVLSPVEL